MGRHLLSLAFALALSAPAHAATLQELEGFLAFELGASASCPGTGECVEVGVAVAPGHGVSDTILFDLQMAWDPSYWLLREIVGAAVVERDDGLGFIDDLFGDVGAGSPIPAGEALFRLIFEVVGGDAPRTVLEIGDLSARDPFFDRAVLVADSEFQAVSPTPNSLLLVPEPGTALLLGMGLLAIALRRRRAALLACAALAPLACGDGGRVDQQRTFLWHSGPANESPFSPGVANPFRGRVAPAKPQRVDLGIFNPDQFGAADPRAIRFHEGDLTVNPAALLSVIPMGGTLDVDRIDPTMLRILTAPNDVLLDLRGWARVVGGAIPARLNETFPGRFIVNPLTVTGLEASPSLIEDFGGDFHADVPCLDPTEPTASIPISNGLIAPPPSALCIESSSTGGGPGPGTPGQIGGTPGNPPGVDPGDPKGSYTPPGLIRMPGAYSERVFPAGGGSRVETLSASRGEMPFRPAPDLPSFGQRRIERSGNALVDLGVIANPNPDGAFAQGLFVPSRGMRLGQPMHWERNVDPATGRPLIGRLDVEPTGACAAAGENAPDTLNAGSLSYNSALASHPFSVTPGASLVDLTAPGLSVLRRGGVGTDPECLRPGGAPGQANAFAFDAGVLADTNALQNHHANLGLLASLCRASLPFQSSIDATACLFNFFSSGSVLQRQIFPISLVESLTALFAGEQTGPAGPPQLFGLLASSQKGALLGSQLSPVPLAPLNSLYNDPADPFDRNLDGDNTDVLDCADSTQQGSCDLGGFDGFDGRVALVGRQPIGISTQIAPFVTLDKALTNEQRALGGCGPFYASRCDSVLPFRDAAKGIAWGGFGGLDLQNGEASALLEVLPAQGASGSTTSADPQLGTVALTGPPACMRRLANGELVRLPGCRGVREFAIGTDDEGFPVVQVEFDPGYLPSQDGCVIGTRINRADDTQVPVVLMGGSAGNAQLEAELELCNGARVRRVVTQRLLVDADQDGTPDVDSNGQPVTVLNPSPLCANGSIGIGAPTDALRVCNAENVTLEDLPLIHPLAGCVDSPAHFPVLGTDDCRYWMYRDLVEELLDGTAHLFRSETAAFSWNLAMFLTTTSCDVRTKDAEGNDHSESSGPQSLEGDPKCFYPPAPYDPTRCSLAAPQHCQNVHALLGLAPPNDEFAPPVDPDGDGVTEDGDGSGIGGDNLCLTHESLACDDNCVFEANTRQVNSNGLDIDGDDIGNACDPDLDNDGDVDEGDRVLQLACFQSATPGPECADADLVGDGFGADPDPDAIRVDGFDRLQLLRWLRGAGVPGEPPGGI